MPPPKPVSNSRSITVGKFVAKRASRADCGFALVIVLWMLVLIAFITAQVTAVGRTEIRIANNLAANAAATAAADGAIYEAIFHLMDPRPDQRWVLDGAEHVFSVGQSQITLRVDDEAGRINPNLASGVLLAGLLQAVGKKPQDAAALARSITEWVGSAGASRTRAELAAEYRQAGLDYTPPMSPLESLDELTRVRGMTPELFNVLQPYLTLFGPAEPNPASAGPVVTAAISLAGGTSLVISRGVRVGTPSTMPPIGIARIHALAQGPGNAEVTRTAIARIGPFTEKGYTLLSWE